jgi:hypothetical protein
VGRAEDMRMVACMHTCLLTYIYVAPFSFSKSGFGMMWDEEVWDEWVYTLSKDSVV